MKSRIPLFAAIVAIAATASFASMAQGQEPYKLPPKVISDILDAPPTPAVVVSPTGNRIAVIERLPMPTITDLSQPLLGLAGARINPATFGPYAVNARSTGIVFKDIAAGKEIRVQGPSDPALQSFSWSPDGSRLLFLNRTANAVELWIADATTGAARKLSNERVNATIFNPCSWVSDGARLLCRFVPQNIGGAPSGSSVPTGPVVQENIGKSAPARTYPDLLRSPQDEKLFDYYATSQLAFVDVNTGALTPIGKPGIYANASLSPDNNHLLVTTIHKPYSYQVSYFNFPRVTEVWNMRGDVEHTVARYPLEDDRPFGYVTALPRQAAWRPSDPATITWIEALDEGNPRNKAEFRDKVMMLRAPFSGAAKEIARTQNRFENLSFTERGIAFVSDYDRAKRWSKTYIVDPDNVGDKARLVWDMSAEDAYRSPGNPVNRPSAGAPRILQRGDWIYLQGPGSSPNGDHPFLDRLNLRTLKTERLWQSDDAHYEIFVGLLDDDASRIITRRESETEVPNYTMRNVKSGKFTMLTSFRDPAPQLAGVVKQLVTYKRADGVDLSATLYLPPGYKQGTRLPVVMWAYPLEFASADVAGQVRGSQHQFTRVGGPSHLLFLTQGYAVFDNPSIPIVGGDTANNSYVDQLVAGAKAAVDKVVDLGVGDRDRIGVGGHSYGAFMTANLLAHTDLFKAGIARSGAYNRTLTPFGFQSEERTFWEAPEIYNRMSPFNYAHKINEPILMIHGMNDNNSGTFPIQSERMFAALKGHGATVRFVYLPLEAHGYTARESVLDVMAEMVEWFDKYVKNAKAITATH
ncbi:MAG TPA: prolyl oligopeptidase family serine peptidase [Longimicrobiales bacterium]|nr:prolyl oligopeptidase family serine peptidase [Longimicrobiales bacterium]